MNVAEFALQATWSGDLQANNELFALIQRANKVLEEELGRSKRLATADWRLVHDGRSRPLLELTLTDIFTKSQVTGSFSPDEFRNDDHFSRRIHRLWGELLQARTESQIKSLLELASQEKEE